MRYRLYTVYAYFKAPDGALNLIERKMFSSETSARKFFTAKKTELINDPNSLATSLELNCEITGKEDFFVADTKNIESFTKQFDFAAS